MNDKNLVHKFVKRKGQIFFILSFDPKNCFEVIQFGELEPFFNNFAFMTGTFATKKDFKSISWKQRRWAIEMVFKDL